MGKQWRGRSPKNVIAEIKQLIDTYNIRQIDFSDENICLDRKRMESICDLIVKNKFDLDWFTPNGVRADTLSETLLRKMKAYGCKKIRLAPESGVQRVVDEIIKKNLKLTDVEQAIVWAKKSRNKSRSFLCSWSNRGNERRYRKNHRDAYKLRRFRGRELSF